MAYSQTPTSKVGDMINAAWLNTYGRDNFNAQSSHAHTGALGDGSADINPDSVTLDSVSEPATPASGKLVLWVDTETAKVKDSSGTVTAISLEGHTHS
jgi:hypothetical protein